MYIIFDTETTGLPKRWDAPITDTDNWPRCIQLAWQIHDEMGNLVEHHDFLIKPDGFDIPYDSEKIHGISTALAEEQGVPLQEVLEKFNVALNKAKFVVGQNIGFDLNIMGCEFYRYSVASNMANMPVLDTCTEVTAELLKIPGGRGGRFKLPNLTELHSYLFGVPFAEAHNATADVEATTRCFLELVRREVFTTEELQVDTGYFVDFKTNNPGPIPTVGLKHINLKAASDEIRKRSQPDEVKVVVDADALAALKDAKFAHLHNHSQFSILQSTMSYDKLVSAAVKDNMPAVALTDHGNMMGAFEFVSRVIGHNKEVEAQNAEAVENGQEPTGQLLKPIVGCEFFVCENHKDKSRKDNGYQIVLLAKNKRGYHNLAKLASFAYTSGFYYVPRIDKDLILQYKEDVIALSGNLQGEVPNKILNIGESQAEEALLWWKEQFGDDFYLELMRHGQEDEDRVNQTLLKFSRKYEVKTVATNNTYYEKKGDAHAHDILLCVKDGEKLSTPKGRGRGFRFGLPNQEYYFKSSDEMKALFKDLPEAILNIQEIVDKIEIFKLNRDVLLPKFDIPEEFQVEADLEDGGKRGENKYLAHLCYVGAEKRYEEITTDIRDRLDFELATIEKTGYPGYFLIVQDFIAAARDMGVSVGPGRGSAAGSAVAYCLGITNIDPIKYDLLFERFLNPDRVSMPDIDIDFDDEGRGRVMQYVINKYGASQVAQIITYGTMAAKSSIKDTARVLDLPLGDANEIAKLIPNLKLSKIFTLDDAGLKEKLRTEEIEAVNRLKSIADGAGLEAETIRQARVLEGSVRNTGIHACGVIITPDDITNFVPVSLAKDSDLYVTQFDNHVVESAGLLKMDFLGLKTLTLIKDTVENVKLSHGIVLDPDQFPIDDELTYELFQRGETIGVFQYESPGMQKYMRDLKPTVFADLIAMNALYRPGPIEYIPSFIKRKHGIDPIVYDLDACEEYLKETYGITVYQEQVMLLSQKLAGFSKGDADVLRKAMGKKQKAVLDKMKPKFVSQAEEKGHNAKVLEKIWTDWEAFASYAFNKSHSTCYAWVAYQTAYLKAHFPAEYMAAVLSNNMNDIKQVTFFMEECKRMGLEVLGPDVNESYYKFTVNESGAIRFGIGAVKGVGAGAVDAIVQTRQSGLYKSVFDMAKRIDLRAVNKKAFESLAYAGGFDSFDNTHRAQYFHSDESSTGMEKAIRFGQRFKENESSAQASLFGVGGAAELPEPVLAPCPQWGLIEKLKYEKDVIGIYLTSHPLDTYRFEIEHFCQNSVSDLALINKVKAAEVDEETLLEFNRIKNKELVIGGIIASANHRLTKTGKPFASFIIEDYSDSYDMAVFGEEYVKLKGYLQEGYFVQLRGLVQERFRQVGNWGFELRSVQLLSDLREKMAKSFTINIPLPKLNEAFLDGIKDILAQNEIEGVVPNCQLKFKIWDPQDEISVEMPAKSLKINLTNEFLDCIDKFEGINYRLN
ncbi:DNA polymerase III subunit alpha [Sphingobacterium paramultivorum]|uniref:DNA polymerase III subunit alpha n=1 Tax=Sphingobacterium paramultivorum TaxID=2886510 RepID=A0A7G5E9T8_9SPHI|nr:MULTISPECIES: DNA polymerase III subunit alpha [Sphingobacterium]MCS4167256.1 DNA polymerase-3 subunit alpha [Sphingobacterium sp. BIGb0116]QMV70763.1 DNA polymerase III subunit alpha [Sphingobacterium paramultivorum]WSO14640.1 DNA polymerase III subunit alpha [Sphingobacterium paramultivorum]